MAGHAPRVRPTKPRPRAEGLAQCLGLPRHRTEAPRYPTEAPRYRSTAPVAGRHIRNSCRGRTGLSLPLALCSQCGAQYLATSDASIQEYKLHCFNVTYKFNKGLNQRGGHRGRATPPKSVVPPVGLVVRHCV